MDCLTLLENSCGNKSLHFANATQFFTFNQIYGLQFWNQLTSLLYLVGTKQQFQKTLYLQTNIYHSSNTQRKLFANKGDLHLCETSAEFLLEPWLVMQLPWHPALYYQWLAAALPEVFKAKKQLSEFYYWPVPKQTFLAVAKLLSMVETLHRRIILGFRLINWLPNSKDSYSSGFDLNSNIALLILNLIVLPSLPTIEFFVGDKFNTVVRAVKRMAWSYTSYKGGSPIEDERFAYTGCAETTDDCRMPAFDLLSDDSGVPTHMFGRINLQEIKDELQKLPVIINLSRMAPLIDQLVSYVMAILCILNLILLYQ
jgi:hypothetical protein